MRGSRRSQSDGYSRRNTRRVRLQTFRSAERNPRVAGQLRCLPPRIQNPGCLPDPTSDVASGRGACNEFSENIYRCTGVFVYHHPVRRGAAPSG
jgi:hypothetical protein